MTTLTPKPPQNDGGKAGRELKGRRVLMTPRVPVYEFDSEADEASEGSVKRFTLAGSVQAPVPPVRGVAARTVTRELTDTIAKEASVFELRAAKLRSVVAENTRLDRRFFVDATREKRVREFALNKQLHHRTGVVPAKPDSQLRLTSKALQDLDLSREYHKMFSHQTTAGSRVAQRLPSTIAVPPLPATPSPCTTPSSHVSKASTDPLCDDPVWKVLQTQLEPGEHAIAHEKRLVEVASAKREEQKLYTLKLSQELAAEEVSDAAHDVLVSHRRAVQRTYHTQVQLAEEEAMHKEQAALRLDTAALSRQLGLVRKVVHQPPFLQAELAEQQRNWGTLFGAQRPVDSNSAKRVNDGGAEVRRWIGVWRHETHIHHESATRIQCAWRQVLAHRKVNRVTLLRRVHVRAQLESEERRENEYTQLMSELWHQKHNNENPHEEAALQVISNFMHICVVRRRRERLLQAHVQSETSCRRTYAATRIQTLYRGNHGRRKAHHKRHPGDAQPWLQSFLAKYCAAVQRAGRGWQARRHLHRVRSAAVRIQARVRGMLARNELDTLRASATRHALRSRRHHAAHVIQRSVRRQLRYKSRHVVPLPPTPTSTTSAHATPQSSVAEEPVHIPTPPRKLSSSIRRCSVQETEAAVKIQSLTRQRNAKRELASRRAVRAEALARPYFETLTREEQDAVVTTLQGAFKIPAAKRELRARQTARESSDEFQAIHMRERERTNAAQAIQCFRRRYNAQQQSNGRLHSRQQAHIACVVEDAVCTIQSAWKGHEVRTHMRLQAQHTAAHRTLRRFYEIYISKKHISRKTHTLQRVGSLMSDRYVYGSELLFHSKTKHRTSQK